MGLERYEIVRPLATTPSAGLSLARDRVSGAPVLLKRLLALHDDVEALDEMLVTEAQLGSRLEPTHPHLLAVLEHGRDTHGRPWLVRPWLEGESLAERLARDPPLPVAALVQAVADAADGLEHLHTDLGVTHNDLCPENLLLGHDGATRVIDLGLARPIGTPATAAQGRAHYRAPELALPGARTHIASDLYALGTLLDDALPAETARALRAIARAARASDPDQRPPSAAALREELAAFGRRWG